MPDDQTGVVEEQTLSYATSWVANGLSWSTREKSQFRLAVSSYIQNYRNYVDIVEQSSSGALVCRASWEHCYPPTKIMFPPKPMPNDYIISTADYLRLWEVNPDPEAASNPQVKRKKVPTLNSKVTQKRIFDSGNTNNFCSPITSCDWNSEDLNIVGCCSIDTTVTIWDLETGEQRTKLVAHDRDVYDIAFASAHTFASCGADGSVRLFDLRTMEHCSVLYETPRLSPLLRIAWNQLDANFISTFGIESLDAVVVDIRYPSLCASRLAGLHRQPLNGMAWSPELPHNICTVAEDGIACLWAANGEEADSLFQNQCDAPVNNVAWTKQGKGWIAVTTGDVEAGLKLLKI